MMSKKIKSFGPVILALSGEGGAEQPEQNVRLFVFADHTFGRRVREPIVVRSTRVANGTAGGGHSVQNR